MAGGGYTRVYIGKLARDCTEREVRKLASEFGHVRDVRLLSGFAFVEYDNEKDAKDCVRHLDGERFLHERIVVEPARLKGRHHERSPSPVRRADRYEPGRRRGGRSRSPPPRKGAVLSRTPYRVNVYGLPSRTSWQSLKDLMRKAGEVTYADVDSRTGDGLVEFASEKDVDEAIKILHETEYEGVKIEVKKARVRTEEDRASRRRDSTSPPPARRRKDDSPRRRRDDSPPPKREKHEDSRNREVKREKEDERDDRKYKDEEREDRRYKDDDRDYKDDDDERDFKDERRASNASHRSSQSHNGDRRGSNASYRSEGSDRDSRDRNGRNGGGIKRERSRSRSRSVDSDGSHRKRARSARSESPSRDQDD
ncbi:hypothetical protein HK097_007143 [Rhizophlyctis rosea]|uniref:RRM domain-containing protein n=1 Tax=Rhizophlyctis rosea TaxID=64517 RepID=A0AAD5X2F8_9FUNG|nr:hypothetical protein HK097_007143 [Rhizophlyctis rosea]